MHDNFTTSNLPVTSRITYKYIKLCSLYSFIMGGNIHYRSMVNVYINKIHTLKINNWHHFPPNDVWFNYTYRTGVDYSHITPALSRSDGDSTYSQTGYDYIIIQTLISICTVYFRRAKSTSTTRCLMYASHRFIDTGKVVHLLMRRRGGGGRRNQNLFDLSQSILEKG